MFVTLYGFTDGDIIMIDWFLKRNDMIEQLWKFSYRKIIEKYCCSYKMGICIDKVSSHYTKDISII